SPAVPSTRNVGSSKYPATISSIRGRSVANRWQPRVQGASLAWSVRFPGPRSRFRVVGRYKIRPEGARSARHDVVVPLFSGLRDAGVIALEGGGAYRVRDPDV